jgi:hypothetical protein
MATHSSGGSIHQTAGMVGPVFIIPKTATYWVDMQTDGGLIQLINVANSAVLTAGSGGSIISLTAGTVVQFKGVGVPSNARYCGGSIIEYNGANLGGER